jgi:hypothetical protein
MYRGWDNQEYEDIELESMRRDAREQQEYERTKYPYRCQECGRRYIWSAEDIAWQFEEPFMPCGHLWQCLRDAPDALDVPEGWHWNGRQMLRDYPPVECPWTEQESWGR